MAAKNLRLVYFDIRGRAEVIRLLLVDQGVPFDDSMITEDQWVGLKQDFCFRQIPCLFEEEKQIVQTGAIMRHLARKLNLYGSNKEEATHLDVFYEGLRDLHEKYVRLIYTEYEEKKEEFIEKVYPNAWAIFESLLKRFDEGKSFVLGEGKLSFVDYVLYEELDIATSLDPSCLENFEALRGFHQRFSERPNIQKRISTRRVMKIPVNGNGKQ